MLIKTTDRMNDKSFAHIDLSYLNLMSDGDDSMKKVMLEMLFEELPTEINAMRALLDGANWQELGSVSHKMKSTLSFVGNESMTEANKNIEENVKAERELNAIPAHIETLENMLPQVMEELKRVHSVL
ncbi:MAG: Hpt domain-containing protein [Saprospiraceae bacterium]